ncbi:hypothetical protein L6R50_16585 [Myxococcota bacterium]|nr:hypothetical protein [Myxococcota bacterium]
MSRPIALAAALATAAALASVPATASPVSGDGMVSGSTAWREEVRGCGGCERAAERRRHPRDSRHFGLGVALMGPAGTVGAFVDVMPFWMLSLQGGWGLGDGRTQAAWVEARLLPARGAWSPVLGVGVDFFFGKVQDPTVEVFGQEVALFSRAAHPFVDVGLAFTAPGGFSGQLGAMLMLTGDPSLPVLPAPSFRFGWYF